MTGSVTDWDLLSSYAGLMTLAASSIYAGSFGSLVVSIHSKLAKRKAADGTVIEDEDDDEEIPDRLSSTDAWLFPVFGSMVLFGLYLVVKYVGKEWINWSLQWYFTIAGVGSVGKSLIALVRLVVGADRWKQFDRNRILVVKGQREFLSFSLRTPSLFLLPLGAIPSMLYNFGPTTTRKSAVLTDILALSFSHNALSLLKLDSFKTGCVLLSGLFVYDIWWVFGTEVMVKVATTLDVPIKLLWAKSMTFSTERGFTMLGLGDVVIPGMFVALALRYDYHRASQGFPVSTFSKPYFTAALCAYLLGLGTTMSVMHFFRKAQPALLYLSPGCILSFLLTATVRGELKSAWEWSDDPELSSTEKKEENGHSREITGADDQADGEEDTAAHRRDKK
ncbi:signal peptide peptidase-domain-containing protein [Cristinia sonorae]|uniref:Signal peptide peptidase-domain-containing protein n=1 Tax=Cristinia sonorae TaxID=1940300 RepID=A0A8K0UG29_9AGAR|nr:signal peptide peptidase-domain-containing protein [Cristinia sonorae]